jgi:hypothetical protein
LDLFENLASIRTLDPPLVVPENSTLLIELYSFSRKKLVLDGITDPVAKGGAFPLGVDHSLPGDIIHLPRAF